MPITACHMPLGKDDLGPRRDNFLGIGAETSRTGCGWLLHHASGHPCWWPLVVLKAEQEILAVTPSREAGKDWRWPEEAEEGEEEPEEVLLLLLQEEAEQAILRPGLQAPSLEDH